MIIKIIDIKPDGLDLSRVYFKIDGGVLESLQMDHSDLASTTTVENAIKDLLKGKQYIGYSFEL